MGIVAHTCNIRAKSYSHLSYGVELSLKIANQRDWRDGSVVWAMEWTLS